MVQSMDNMCVYACMLMRCDDILCIFFSHFNYGLIKIIGVSEQLYMVYEIFFDIFILSHIILIFPKLDNS